MATKKKAVKKKQPAKSFKIFVGYNPSTKDWETSESMGDVDWYPRILEITLPIEKIIPKVIKVNV